MTALFSGMANACNYGNGGCHHICDTNERGHVMCQCNDGFTLQADMKTCGCKFFVFIIYVSFLFITGILTTLVSLSFLILMAGMLSTF